MPAETHTRTERIDADTVLDLLACAVGIDDGRGGVPLAEVPLADLELDDDLAILDLWESVAEELGERALGDLDLEGTLPATLGGLAELFEEALRSRPAGRADV